MKVGDYSESGMGCAVQHTIACTRANVMPTFARGHGVPTRNDEQTGIYNTLASAHCR